MTHHSDYTLPLPHGEPMPQYFADKVESGIRCLCILNATTQVYVRADRLPDGSYQYTLQRLPLTESNWFDLKARWTPTTRESFLETLALVASHTAKALTHFSK